MHHLEALLRAAADRTTFALGGGDVSPGRLTRNRASRQDQDGCRLAVFRSRQHPRLQEEACLFAQPARKVPASLAT